MSERRIRAAACAGVLFALVALPAQAAMADFVGRWRNSDPGTRGLTQLSIRAESGQLVVQAWGKCHPNDCDWGQVPAQLFTPNVGVPTEAGADAAIVQFDFGGAQTMLMLQTVNGELSYKAFTIFQSGDRSNYHQGGRLVRW